MFTAPQRDYDIAEAWSDLIEDGYGTVLGFDDLDQRSYFNNPEAFRITKQYETDGNKYGTGLEGATQYIDVARDLRLTRSGDLSSKIAGRLFALLAGDEAVVFDDPGYSHSFTPKAPADGLHAASTSAWLKESEGVRGRAHGLCLNSLTISGRNQQAVQYSAEFVGSGQFTSGDHTALPGLATEVILRGGDVSVLLGAIGSAAAFGDRILDWTVTFNNNLKDALGYFPGSGLYRGRMFMGRRTVSVTLNAFADDSSDLFDLFLNGTVRELQINCAGDADNFCNIDIPSLRFNSGGEPRYEDGILVRPLVASERDIFIGQPSATPDDNPYLVVVSNLVPAYLQTPA
jgi:hypothetical protein